MITIDTVAVSAFSPSGRNIESLDAQSVQSNFNKISTEFNMQDNRISEIAKRITELESFTHWVSKHHPDVVHEYVVTKAAKEKIGVKA